MTKTKKTFDVYEMVTDRILASLDNGEIPWRKPWVSAMFGQSGCVSSKECAVSYATGKPYSFVNQMLLPGPGEYATFKQVAEAGGKVKKGAKSSQVVFWKMLKVEDEEHLDKDGKPTEKVIPMLKYFNVFLLSDCEGIEPKWETPKPKKALPNNDIPEDERAEAIMTAYAEGDGVKINYAVVNEAAYRPSEDKIFMPERGQFENASGFYATLFHEGVHSTGHKSRLDRLEKVTRGSLEYDREELVAEIGATALCNYCGLETPQVFDNAVAYIQSWTQKLRDDKKAIVIAGGRAQKAIERILSHSEQESEEAA